jgi:hypothetical protein
MKPPSRYELIGFHLASPEIRDHCDGPPKDLRSLSVAFVTAETIKKISKQFADQNLELIMLRKTSNHHGENHTESEKTGSKSKNKAHH